MLKRTPAFFMVDILVASNAVFRHMTKVKLVLVDRYALIQDGRRDLLG